MKNLKFLINFKKLKEKAKTKKARFYPRFFSVISGKTTSYNLK